ALQVVARLYVAALVRERRRKLFGRQFVEYLRRDEEARTQDADDSDYGEAVTYAVGGRAHALDGDGLCAAHPLALEFARREPGARDAPEGEQDSGGGGRGEEYQLQSDDLIRMRGLHDEVGRDDQREDECGCERRRQHAQREEEARTRVRTHERGAPAYRSPHERHERRG